MENSEQKETYQQKIQEQLDEWRAEIDNLKQRAKDATAETKARYQEQIDRLELKLDEGKEKLKDLRESGSEAWDAVKEGADSIWDTMKATFAEVREKLRDRDENEKP
jgi:predicted  nucleic acid-binding Zn-ribbon protein